MPSKSIGVPYGAPNDATRGTTYEDAQYINSALYSYTGAGGVISGAEISPSGNASIFLAPGAVLLATGPNKAVIVPIPRVGTTAAVQSGQEGYSYVSVGMSIIAGQANLAELITRTTPPPANEVYIGRVYHPNGWKSMADCRTQHSLTFALPAGSSGQSLGGASNTSRARITTQEVTVVDRVITLPFASGLKVDIASTIRATADGNSQENGASGGVAYRLFVNGRLVQTFERRYDAIASTEQWSNIVTGDEKQYRIKVTAQRTFAEKGSGGWQAYSNINSGHRGDEVRFSLVGRTTTSYGPRGYHGAADGPNMDDYHTLGK